MFALILVLLMQAHLQEQFEMYALYYYAALKMRFNSTFPLVFVLSSKSPFLMRLTFHSTVLCLKSSKMH